MIVGIAIRNFRIIKEIAPAIELGAFHVLVGPNASGKSTFLDALDFVRDCVRDGPRSAVESRVPDLRDLTFMRRGGAIEIDLWLDMGSSLPSQQANLIRYQLSVQSDNQLGISVADELKQYSKSWIQGGKGLRFSPNARPKRLLGKTSKGSDFYKRETGTYQDSFVFGQDKLALSSTPPDMERYPTGNAVRAFLLDGIRYLQLNSRAMRGPCPATRPTTLQLDGTNLARVVGALLSEAARSKRAGPLFESSTAVYQWTAHLKYALQDLKEIGWARRESDNAEYLVLKYENGLDCPSWLLSDGTLRMLALTLPAFLPPEPALYLVEEPENGVHPKALDIILRALSCVPDAQMFVATHSPLVVQEVGIDPLLCFIREEQGARIVHGREHPIIRGWKDMPDIATVFASGILG